MFERWNMDLFSCPRISLSTQRLQTVPCIDSLFNQSSCCCVQMYSANVCKECVLWLKYKITVFSRCMGWLHIPPVLGDMLHKMPNSLWGSSLSQAVLCGLPHPCEDLWDFQVQSYVRIKYSVIESVVTLGFGVKTIVLSFSWKCLSVFFPAIVWFINIWPFHWFFREGVCQCHETLSVWVWCWTWFNLRMVTCVFDYLFRKCGGFFEFWKLYHLIAIKKASVFIYGPTCLRTWKCICFSMKFVQTYTWL